MGFQRLNGKNGFLQVMALLETCSNSRQLELMRAMNYENPALAALVKAKVLSIDHIAGWTSVELRQLSAELTNELRGYLFSVLLEAGHHSKLKEIGVPLDTKFKSLTPSERDHFGVLIVLKARELERIGILEMWRFDPTKSMHDHVSRQDQAHHSKPA